jgi:hypothetical protein
MALKAGGPSFLITVRSFAVDVKNIRTGEIEVARCFGENF